MLQKYFRRLNHFDTSAKCATACISVERARFTIAALVLSASAVEMRQIFRRAQLSRSGRSTKFTLGATWRCLILQDNSTIMMIHERCFTSYKTRFNQG